MPASYQRNNVLKKKREHCLKLQKIDLCVSETDHVHSARSHPQLVSYQPFVVASHIYPLASGADAHRYNVDAA